MFIASIPLWFASTNCWVVAPAVGGPAVIIDAPPDAAAIADLLASHDLHPVATILTHGHVDHTGAAGTLERTMGTVTHVHPDDDFLTSDPLSQVRALFGGDVPGDYESPKERIDLVHGATVDAAGVSFQVLHTPGHTPGHCCLYVADSGVLFSGDQLFAGSIGRTDLPGGSTADLMRSMRHHVMALEDDVRVLPGHGPETTIGRERLTNPFRSMWEETRG